MRFYKLKPDAESGSLMTPVHVTRTLQTLAESQAPAPKPSPLAAENAQPTPSSEMASAENTSGSEGKASPAAKAGGETKIEGMEKLSDSTGTGQDLWLHDVPTNSVGFFNFGGKPLPAAERLSSPFSLAVDQLKWRMEDPSASEGACRPPTPELPEVSLKEFMRSFFTGHDLFCHHEERFKPKNDDERILKCLLYNLFCKDSKKRSSPPHKRLNELLFASFPVLMYELRRERLLQQLHQKRTQQAMISLYPILLAFVGISGIFDVDGETPISNDQLTKDRIGQHARLINKREELSRVLREPRLFAEYATECFSKFFDVNIDKWLAAIKLELMQAPALPHNWCVPVDIRSIVAPLDFAIGVKALAEAIGK